MDRICHLFEARRRFLHAAAAVLALVALTDGTVTEVISGDLHDWEEAVVGVFVDNLRRFVAGEPLRNAVDTEAGFGVG